VLFLLVLLITQSAQACPDVASCKAAALEAYSAKDYERFHDLAWVTYRKGKADDPELMLLLARAQSLSGRAGDAVVMLQRLSARGVSTDVETSEDFAAVRALPKRDASADAPVTAIPPKAAAPSSTVARSAKVEPPPPDPPRATPPRAAGAPLTFTTLLSPSALAYDAVSRRYLIADQKARRVAVVDENSGHVSTLAGAQARLGDINGIAIDARQGDLWVITTAEEGASLHRLQLISGRELGAARLSGLSAPVVGMAFVRGVGIVIADGNGDISRVLPSGRIEKLGALEYVPRAIAADAEGTLYVAAGGPRLARFAVGPGLKRIGVTELPSGMSTDAPFTIVNGQVRFVASASGAYEIRR
jgi:hypothetical protein